MESSGLVRPATLTEAVVEHLRKAIIDGVHIPGAALPEATLARELGTSRGTVREALRALDDLGLVEIIPHRGARVATMTAQRAREIYDLRIALEGFAARDAIERGLIDQIARREIEAAFSSVVMAAEQGDVIRLITEERALHATILDVTDNRLLQGQIRAMQDLTRYFLIHYRHTLELTSELAEHRLLVESVLGDDPELAERVVRQHVRRARDLVLASMAAASATRLTPEANTESGP